jgi:predicted Zn-dependent peptidase
MKLLKKKLKNGITVIMEKRELPLVAVAISNSFGGAYEDLKIKGVAHLIEHVLFTGTSTRSAEDISAEIEKRGGILNGFTSDETTAFLFKLPSEHLFAGLDILIDMVKNPKFDEEKFEKEKSVVLEEIKMYQDEPRMRALKKIVENLYELPFGAGVIGTKESVSGLKRDFVVDLFEKTYCPDNYLVTIVGDADFEKVCAYLEKNFSKCKKKDNKIIKIVKRNAESIEKKPGIDQANLCFGMHAPRAGTEDYYAFEVLDAFLTKGMSSRLFLEIREKRGLAYAVRGMIETEKDYSHYVIYVGTKKDAVDEVKKLILKGFEDAQNMTEKELEDAKVMLIGLAKLESESSEDVMSELMGAERATGAEEYYKYEEKIKKVKLEDVRRVAKIGKYSIAAVVPE